MGVTAPRPVTTLRRAGSLLGTSHLLDVLHWRRPPLAAPCCSDPAGRGVLRQWDGGRSHRASPGAGATDDGIVPARSRDASGPFGLALSQKVGHAAQEATNCFALGLGQRVQGLLDRKSTRLN